MRNVRPSYQSYVVKARQGDARLALLSVALKLEKFYFEQDTYQGAQRTIKLPFTSAQGFYQVEAKLQSYAYQLKAIPRQSQVADKKCNIFSLDDKGNKMNYGQNGELTVEQCWLG